MAATGGVRLHARVWDAEPARALCVVVHGLGDHAGRYGELAEALRARGISVVAYDQRGHGRSPGRRGDAPEAGVLIEDLRSVMGWAGREASHRPLLLLGQSMGALLILGHLRGRGRAGPAVAGAVLSSPWLRTLHPVPRWKRALAKVARLLAPGVPFRTPSDPAALTRDPDRRLAFEADSLVHDRVTPRLFFSLEELQEEVLHEGVRRPPPLLLLVPEEDPLADPGATLDLAARLEPGRVQTERLEGGLHEPFQDIDRERVLERVLRWIEGVLDGEPATHHRVSNADPAPGEVDGHAWWSDMTNEDDRQDAPNESGDRPEGAAVDEPAARPEGAPVDERGDRSEGAEGEDAGEPPRGAGTRDPGEEPGEGGDDPRVDDEVRSLHEEFQSLEDRHLRLAAEFNNFRRRAETERTEAWSRAQAELVGRLLEPLDDLQRVSGLDGDQATLESLLEGVQLVERKLRRTLEDAGAELVAPEPGEVFDPEAMEAMMRVPTDDPEEDDTVEAVFQPGYRFRGQLVRPARVSVRKHD